MDGSKDGWALALFGLHLGQAILVASLYPLLRYGTDLIAYFVYFRSWWGGDASLEHLGFFVVPKPLLVFTLGALGNVPAAFACTAVASAGLGVLVYRLGRDVFGRTVGILLSLALLLDAEKAMLTVRSHADLYVTVFLIGAVCLMLRRRFALASVGLLLAALIKPVALPCALALLASDEGRRRWYWALLPLVAVPLVLLANETLLGAALGPSRFIARFDDLHAGSAVGPVEVIHFALWTQLVDSVFVSTAPWGLLGLAAWVARDRQRLSSPMILVPLLFLAGYAGFAAVAPFAPFFRFFWPIQIWFLGFVLFAMVETTRRLGHGRPALRAAMLAAVLLFLVDDQLVQQAQYRERFAQPQEEAMAFVARAADTLVRERRAGEAVYSPLAFAPYLMWRGGVPADELVAGGNQPRTRPAWILYLPDPEHADTAGDPLVHLTRDGGYVVRLAAGSSALLALPPAGQPGAGSGT